jgi:hypothetical protein
MNVILVGTDDALLEGLAQSFAAGGLKPHVVGTLYDAGELAAEERPIMVVVDREIALRTPADVLAVQLAPGGSVVLYRGHSADQELAVTPPMLQRSVLAELSLPLERNRLTALAMHVHGRAITTGRDSVFHPPLEVRP